MRKLIASVLVTIPYFLQAQCFEVNNTTIGGEYLKYKVSYHWGLIWLDAAMVDFRTDSTLFEGKPAYHFTSHGNTHPGYDWIYKVRDVYESYASAENLRPFRFERNLSEGSYKAYNQYKFDYGKNSIHAIVQDNDRDIKQTMKLVPCAYDVLTATYAVRNIKFENYQPDDTIPLTFILDENFIELNIRYLGKEKIENHNGKVYNCLKFTSNMIESSLFASGEPLVVYVTDDRNKIPVLIIAELIIGSVKVYVVEHSGLRHQLYDDQTKTPLHNPNGGNPGKHHHQRWLPGQK